MNRNRISPSQNSHVIAWLFHQKTFFYQSYYLEQYSKYHLFVQCLVDWEVQIICRYKYPKDLISRSRVVQNENEALNFNWRDSRINNHMPSLSNGNISAIRITIKNWIQAIELLSDLEPMSISHQSSLPKRWFDILPITLQNTNNLQMN